VVGDGETAGSRLGARNTDYSVTYKKIESTPAESVCFVRPQVQTSRSPGSPASPYKTTMIGPRASCLYIWWPRNIHIPAGNKRKPSQHRLYWPPGEHHLFQSCDLLANEEVERHFGHEEAGSSAVGVVDGRPDVLVCQPLERVYGGQAVGKYLVKDVAAVRSQKLEDAAAPVAVEHNRQTCEKPIAPNEGSGSSSRKHENSRACFYPVPQPMSQFESNINIHTSDVF